MHPLVQFLQHVFGGQSQAQQPQAQSPYPQSANAASGTPMTLPDVTYNPNPATNIPYSTHNFQQAQQFSQISPQHAQSLLPLIAMMHAYGAMSPSQQPPTAHAAQQAQIPVGQPIPQAVMNSFNPQTRALAQIYQQNPTDPRVAHIDPKIFGYAPDNTVAPRQGSSAMGGY